MKRYSRNWLDRVLVITAIAFFLAFLAGCNFSSSSTPGSTILSGVASAGPIVAGTISAYQVVNGAKDALLGTTSTDSNGNYTLDIGSYTGPVLLEVTGGSYKDEATGVSTTLSATLSSIVANASGSTTASVTPISDAVVQNTKAASGGLTSANIAVALSTMKSQTGFDPIATLPADPTSETSLTATDAAKAYAAYLGAISQYLKDNAGKTLAQSVTDFAGVIQGAGLASSTAIQTAMNNFLTSDKNKTGLTQPALQTLTTNLINTVNAGSDSVVLTYGISGKVTLNGAGLSGVTVSLTGASTTTTTTDVNGNYAFAGALNGSYTVGASLTGYAFTPTSISATVSGANLTGQDFAVTYTISGKITLDGVGLSGVTVSLTGASTTSTTTDANGNYAFAGALNGSYTIAPSRTGYAFSPASSAITVNGANLTGQDFTVVTYTISGKITVNGAALSGVTVSLTGASTTSTTTDANGNYAFAGALNGNYTLTTSLAGYDFSPASNSITVNGANLTGQGYTATVNTVALSGTVSAPGGSLAFNQPAGFKRFFAKLTKFFIADAMAENNTVGPGITVNLIQINNTGTQVGSILATAITDALGNYILQAPKGFDPEDPARKYVVQAISLNGVVTLQSFVTGTTNDVDPYSDTTVQLITKTTSSTSGASLTNVTAADVAAVLQTVTSHSADVSTTATNVNTLVADLQSVIANSADSSNIIASITSPFGITGTVTDSNNNPLANIKIAVVTSVEWVTQAIIRTDVAGRYTVHVPDGDYVLAAFNTTTSSPAASAWWTSGSGGGATSMWSAEKITVAGAMVTKDFKLDLGGRISGKVTAKANGKALNGIQIKLRDFTNTESLMNVRTGQDGAYNFNVAPGTYYISVMNGTLEQAYATEVFNSPDGGNNQVQAQKLVIAAGDVYTANMSLLAGSKIEGKVTDENGSPIAGIFVRVFDATGMFTEGQGTGKDGSYRFWLRPGIYSLLARGQTASNVDISIASTSKVVTFNAAVSEITAKLVDASGIPVSQAYAEVYDASTAALIGREHSNGDGSVTVYSDPATTVAILFKISSGDPIGSSIYLNKTRAGLATTITAPTSLGTVTMPAGGVLNGIVTKGGVPAAGALIQVRKDAKSYGTNGIYCFVNVRTMIDGSYTVSLPLNVKFDRICAVDAGLTAGTCTGTGTSPLVALKSKAFDDQTLTLPTTTLNFAY